MSVDDDSQQEEIDEKTAMQTLRSVMQDDEARNALALRVDSSSSNKIAFCHDVAMLAAASGGGEESTTTIAKHIKSGRITPTKKEARALRHLTSAAAATCPIAADELFWVLDAIKSRCMRELASDAQVQLALLHFNFS